MEFTSVFVVDDDDLVRRFLLKGQAWQWRHYRGKRLEYQQYRKSSIRLFGKCR